jgi:hypothetical protein
MHCILVLLHTILMTIFCLLNKSFSKILLQQIYIDMNDINKMTMDQCIILCLESFLV